jgi:hypothetical protein
MGSKQMVHISGLLHWSGEEEMRRFRPRRRRSGNVAVVTAMGYELQGPNPVRRLFSLGIYRIYRISWEV